MNGEIWEKICDIVRNRQYRTMSHFFYVPEVLNVHMNEIYEKN